MGARKRIAFQLILLKPTEEKKETTKKKPRIEGFADAEDIDSVCKKERASERGLSGGTIGKARGGRQGEGPGYVQREIFRAVRGGRRYNVDQ